MKLTLAIAVAAVVTAFASTASAGTQWRSNVWQSPSGNIICAYRSTSQTVDCMTRNDGYTLSLSRYRAGYRWHNNSVRIHVYSPVLRYGWTWYSNDDAIRCNSRTTGMFCRSGSHGIFLSADGADRW
jgi:hypothetical protein